jgi:N-carbamoylputrescine amidase
MGPDHAVNEQYAITAMGKARDLGASVVVFPELRCLPFFPAHPADPEYFEWAVPVPGPVVGRFQEAARGHRLVTVINVYEKAGPGRYHDTSPVIDADGTLLGATRMAHIAEEPGFHEKFYYCPGDTVPHVYDTQAGRIGISICYDRHYPEHLRALAVLGAEIILVPTACLEGEDFAMYEVELQAASFDSQVFTAFCNRTGSEGPGTFAGRSFVTGPDGRVVKRAGSGEEVLVADCDPALIDQVRKHRFYMHDRRPDLYWPLTDRRVASPSVAPRFPPSMKWSPMSEEPKKL